MSEKPKRQMTPEHLEKLAIARAKANEVRSKQSLVKKAEKEEERKKKQQELEEKYKQVTGKAKPTFTPPQQKDKVVDEKLEDEAKTQDDKKLTAPKKKVKKVFEIDSDEGSSSSSDSDDEYDISPIKQKYKQKYRQKYSARYTQPIQQPYNPHQDAVTIAKFNIQSKVNQEVQKMAMASLFG